ncbi:MAG: SDR family NAD(P)-dependent oxidoreductase [Actinomycetota bacterium]|nr:SDR family NAD(P)-dependent oxidoreductase [Actinomycetota bacterium]
MAGLQGRVAVVTGASRGAGKGIALALGGAGATVYVTGRTRDEGTSAFPGTVFATAAEVTRRGGVGVPVVCDHADDTQVEALFAQVSREHGSLDILVNNAFAIPDRLTSKRPFWDKPLDHQGMLDVGLRSTYVASWFAAPLMVTAATAGRLIVNTSSFGGRCYMHGPAYGAAKAGVDKMAHDMAEDLRPFGVAAISLWMGMLRTERTAPLLEAAAQQYGPLATQVESAEFPGRVVTALALSPELMTYSGQVLLSAELGVILGVTEVDGSQPPSHRQELGGPTRFNPAVVR